MQSAAAVDPSTSQQYNPLVSNVTNMESMFYYSEAFNQPIEKWDVSKVTNMEKMFSCSKAFNQPIEKWDVSNVTNMEYMFYGALSFKQTLPDEWKKKAGYA